MADTTIRKKMNHLTLKKKDELRDEIRNLLRGRVQEAYIFGSFVTGELLAESDLDLIVVTETSRSFIERPLDFPDLLDRDYAVDLLVYTPQEFQKIRKDETFGFWRNVLRSMVRIL